MRKKRVLNDEKELLGVNRSRECEQLSRRTRCIFHASFRSMPEQAMLRNLFERHLDRALPQNAITRYRVEDQCCAGMTRGSARVLSVFIEPCNCARLQIKVGQRWTADRCAHRYLPRSASIARKIFATLCKACSCRDSDRSTR